MTVVMCLVICSSNITFDFLFVTNSTGNPIVGLGLCSELHLQNGTWIML